MKKTIITISRETGSGGHTIGVMLAKKLGYQLYDEEIATQVSKETGMKEDMILENGEFMSDDMFLDFAAGFIPFSRKEPIPFEEIEKKESTMIQKIAKEGNCIIVGRGADFILKDDKKAFHVFIHADMDHRVKRVQRHDQVSGEEERIRRELMVKDRSRKAYYHYFTNREWGNVGNYHMTLDTSIFTKTQCVQLIIEALKKLEEKENAEN